MKKRILSLALALCLVLCAAVPALAAEPDGVLRFDENGEFKILHMTDCQDGYPARTEMLTYINYMLDIYEPDLVVLGGDNCVCEGKYKQPAIAELVKPYVDRGIYFTLVFGNHDHEQGVDEETLLSYYLQAGGKYCLAYDAVPSLSGTATHNLPVYGTDGKIKFNVWLFDSGAYVHENDDESAPRLGYDCVRPDQIEWYKETYEDLKKEAGADVPSMAFQHIVVGDVYYAMFPSSPFELSPITETHNGGENYAIIFPNTSIFKGHIYEPPAAGYYNHGQFDAMVETGDVLAIYCGHDHINSYELEYKGIDIINTPGCTFNAYGNEIVRGSRLITINENAPEDYVNEVITVNELALENSEFAEAMGISPIKAGFWVFMDKFLLGLKNASAIFAAIIY